MLLRMSCCALGLLLASSVVGCQSFPSRSGGQTLLKKPVMSPDTVVLEVFSVHLRRDDSELYDAIWKEVDEQAIDADARQQLAENGFRVGMVSGHLPRPVQRLLELHSQPQPDAEPEPGQANALKLDGKPQVRIQQMQLHARRRGEIAASGTYESASLLFREKGQLLGQSFQQCQGMLAVNSSPGNDGRVRLEIVPEFHHGGSRRRFTSFDGIIRLDTGRPRRTFTALTHEVTFSPGDLYVVSGLPQRPGSLGDYFFAVNATDPPQRKVLFVRLAQTQLDDLFLE